ncbi:MAG: mechanosensitive ion channel family protein [Sandaracinaceae bacterium]
MDSAIERVLSKLTDWWNAFFEMLPNLAVAVLVLLVFWGLGRLVRRATSRGLERTSLHRAAVPTLSKTVSFVVLTIGLIVALHVLALDRAASSLLAGAGVVGLALGLAFQDVAANYFAGFALSIRHPFDVGDILETNGTFGYVDSIELRTTKIRTFDGILVSVPNRKVFEDVMKNYTQLGRRRVEVPVGVSYAADLDEVEAVTRRAIEGVERRVESEAVQVFFTGFGGSSIDLVARFWIDVKNGADVFVARHQAIIAIKKAYDDAGISIPFPIRTLDFGILGGEKLSAMWPQGANDPGRGSIGNSGNGNGKRPSAEATSP